MSRRRAGRPSGGGTEQHEVAFAVDHGCAGAVSSAHATPMVILTSSPELGEAVLVSPTSILQTAAASPMSPADTCGDGGGGTPVPFSRTGDGRVCSGERRSKSRRRPWEAKSIGLGLVSALNREAPDDGVPCASSTVVTGQIRPCFPPSKELGVGKSSRTSTKTKVTALAVAPSPARHASPRRRCPSPREMDQQSEDYTRVIARWPSPRTTHIFDNRVVDNGCCCWFPAAAAAAATGEAEDFLRRCHGCSKDLGEGKDIFMYRGERAFCSRECRHREMMYDGGTEL